ncbi:hypothetical protein [Candidatus Palauibacter sp.]|uniref:hypothetical protein n=1 Tax=Candidatus Palauibacter sp. TaxID=3101350 RepID=UPI003B58C797
MDLEVTHLLSITTVGLTVPYERLRKGSRTPHPSDDRRRYKRAASEYNRLLEKTFPSSQLWLDGASTWRTGEVEDVRAQAPDFVPAFASAEPMQPDYRAECVVRIMRNALAHANIVTRGTRGREINDIMFLSEKRYPAFRFVAVEPEDLRKFMMNYFEFLSRLDLGRGQLVGGAPEAA